MRYSVIAIEREYASGGLEIGKKLAETLGVPCYGQEILYQAAEKMNLPVEQLKKIEESITGSILHSLAVFANITSGKSDDSLSIEQRLAFAEADVIRSLSYNSCVLIGRGACALLKDNANVLKVFIHADKKARKLFYQLRQWLPQRGVISL